MVIKKNDTIKFSLKDFFSLIKDKEDNYKCVLSDYWFDFYISQYRIYL